MSKELKTNHHASFQRRRGRFNFRSFEGSAGYRVVKGIVVMETDRKKDRKTKREKKENKSKTVTCLN